MSRLLCKCMNLSCQNEHADPVRVMLPIRPLTIPDDPEPFTAPDGALPVLMQVGESPVTCIGWVLPGEGNTSALLRDVANEIEAIEQAR